MDVAELVRRRAAVAAAAAAHESVPHSPWSPRHPDMLRTMTDHKEATGRDYPLLSMRPVGFHVDDSVVFVGPDAELIAAKAKEPWTPTEFREHHQIVVSARAACAKVELRHADGIPFVEIFSQRWNGVALALGEMGIVCRLAEGG